MPRWMRFGHNSPHSGDPYAPENELEALQGEAEFLEKSLEQLRKRMEKLKKEKKDS
jgi:hypothetical protein